MHIINMNSIFVYSSFYAKNLHKVSVINVLRHSQKDKAMVIENTSVVSRGIGWVNRIDYKGT